MHDADFVMPAGLWGALQHFRHHPSVSLSSIFTPSPALHFLSSFCSETLPLLSLPLSFLNQCALSHTHTHTLFQVIPPLVPLFHKCWTSIFLPFIPLSLQSLIFGACLLFCCGFLMDFENCSTSSPIQSTWNKIYTHWQQITKDISSLTLFLLYPFVIHCTTVLQRVIISMAIHTNALSVCCLIGRRSKKQ